MKYKYLVAFVFLWISANYSQAEKLTVFQFNIWQEGTVVEDGFDAIVSVIAELEPDIVTFSEVRNYNEVDFISHVCQALQKAGKTYYGKSSVSTGIISRYPVIEQQVIYPLVNDRGSVLKAVFQINNKRIVCYSAHLDWLNCASYLPRGYHSSTWEKLVSPVTNADLILEDNRSSYRIAEVKAIIDDADREVKKGSLIVIGGDFNEPSHLDWGTDTKDIRDHQGLVIGWDCSLLLEKNGFTDAYREQYPDPVSYPGFTFPADTKEVDLEKLVWAPDADERERIDFIYYKKNPQMTLEDIIVVGPSGNIEKGKRTGDTSQDRFLTPQGKWPTDHKGVYATFLLK